MVGVWHIDCVRIVVAAFTMAGCCLKGGVPGSVSWVRDGQRTACRGNTVLYITGFVGVLHDDGLVGVMDDGFGVSPSLSTSEELL